jgi:Predicted endonuclease containing a URI domain
MHDIFYLKNFSVNATACYNKKEALMFIVYLLKCADGTLYCGYTDNVEKRVAKHNAGKGAKYTKSRLPVTLVYFEKCADKSTALRREIEIKRLTRAEKLKLIEVGKL